MMDVLQEILIPVGLRTSINMTQGIPSDTLRESVLIIQSFFFPFNLKEYGLTRKHAKSISGPLHGHTHVHKKAFKYKT